MSSSVYVLVTISQPPGLLDFMEVDGYLTDVLEAKSGLVMKEAFKPGIGDRIVHEVVTSMTPEGRHVGDPMVSIKMKRLACAENLPLPHYQSDGASGMDIRAAVGETTSIQPGQIALIPTGICLSIPPGFEGQLRPRSGLALRHGICLLNSPGTVDSDYRGEVQVILANLGTETFEVKRGDRIAQLVVAQVVRARLEPVRELDETQRGAGGFGHTGV